MKYGLAKPNGEVLASATGECCCDEGLTRLNPTFTRFKEHARGKACTAPVPISSMRGTR